MLRLAVACDHTGVDLKAIVIEALKQQGHLVTDLGTHDASPVDYPDYALAIARSIREGSSDRGVLICGSGVGASIAANKVPGIRAGLCHDTYSAHQGVEHDDMNVLVMGARVIGAALATEIAVTFSRSAFSAEERHVRRLAKVRAIEEGHRH